MLNRVIIVLSLRSFILSEIVYIPRKFLFHFSHREAEHNKKKTKQRQLRRSSHYNSVAALSDLVGRDGKNNELLCNSDNIKKNKKKL